MKFSKLKTCILSILLITMFVVLSVNISESANPMPRPKFTIVMHNPSNGDDFIFAILAENIVITKVQGILQSGTSISGTVAVCDANGENCDTNIEPYMTFDGDLDTYSSIDNPYADKDQTLKWITNTVSSPGFVIIVVHYRVR